MLRVLAFGAVVALGVLGMQALATVPGELTLSWDGSVSTRLTVPEAVLLGSVLLIGAVGCAALVSWLSRRVGRRRRQLSPDAQRAMDAAATAMFALEARDGRAGRAIARAERLGLPSLLAHLLRAHDASAAGEEDTARRHWRALAQEPATALAGLRGLFRLAMSQKDPDRARRIAERIAAALPRDPEALAYLEQAAAASGDAVAARRYLQQRGGDDAALGRRWRAEADHLADAGDIAAARRAIRNALRADPADAESCAAVGPARSQGRSGPRRATSSGRGMATCARSRNLRCHARHPRRRDAGAAARPSRPPARSKRR